MLLSGHSKSTRRQYHIPPFLLLGILPAGFSFSQLFCFCSCFGDIRTPVSWRELRFLRGPLRAMVFQTHIGNAERPLYCQIRVLGANATQEPRGKLGLCPLPLVLSSSPKRHNAARRPTTSPLVNRHWPPPLAILDQLWGAGVGIARDDVCQSHCSPVYIFLE